MKRREAQGIPSSEAPTFSVVAATEFAALPVLRLISKFSARTASSSPAAASVAQESMSLLRAAGAAGWRQARGDVEMVVGIGQPLSRATMSRAWRVMGSTRVMRSKDLTIESASYDRTILHDDAAIASLLCLSVDRQSVMPVRISS